MSIQYYEQLTKRKDILQLARLGLLDERVYHVLAKAKDQQQESDGLKIDDVINALPLHPAVIARFLAHAACYPQYNDALTQHVALIAEMLVRSESTIERAAFSDLLGSLSLSEKNHSQLFQSSELYQKLMMDDDMTSSLKEKEEKEKVSTRRRHPFVGRGVIRLLAWLFANDKMSDATAQLQYKTDLIKHVNKITVDSSDIPSVRFAVRVLALSGGYNEDKKDVFKTERWVMVNTQWLPAFFSYFSVGLLYGFVRHWPKRLRPPPMKNATGGEVVEYGLGHNGQVPRWLRRHRAIFTGVTCGLLGVLHHALGEFRLIKQRLIFAESYQQEMRKRNSDDVEAKGKGGNKNLTLPRKQNPYFDNLEGVTKRIWWLQLQHYAIIAVCLTLTCFPASKCTWPIWMGDVVFHHPLVPRLLPATVGLPCATRAILPFAVVPFVMVTALSHYYCVGATLYDVFVQSRHKWWKKSRWGRKRN